MRVETQLLIREDFRAHTHTHTQVRLTIFVEWMQNVEYMQNIYVLPLFEK